MKNLIRRIKYYFFRGKSLKEGPIVTFVVLALCVIVFALQLILEMIYGSDINAMIVLGGYYRNYVIMLNDYWRLVTYGLVHGGFFHLFMNMSALVNLGTTLESMVGHKKYALVLLISTFGGGMVAHLTNSELVVGLSGGLYGLLGLLVVIAYKQNWFQIPSVQSSLIRTLFMNILISLMPSVSLAGHLGGFVVGVLLGLIFTTPYSEQKSIYYYNKIAATCLFLAILGGMTIRNKNIVTFYSNDTAVLQIYQDLGVDVTDSVHKIYSYYQNWR